MAKCQNMEYEYITVELESNSREFMQTKKYPPNRWAKISVNWVEEWRDKDREVVELEFTRIINSGSNRKDSYSFAFQLASGLTSSLSKTKLWDKHHHRIEGSGWERWQEFKDLHKTMTLPPPRVVRVVISVMF